MNWEGEKEVNPSQGVLIYGCTFLDPSNSVPGESAGILVKDGKIAGYVDHDSMKNLDKDQIQLINASGLSLLPGFIDCHLHLTGLSQGLPPSSWLIRDVGELLIRAVRQAWELLMAGFTTVVDNSHNGSIINSMIRRKEIVGPRIIPCGKGLAATGGAGHVPYFPERLIRQRHPWAITCDGVDKLRLEVRKLRRDGSDWIKFWTSGAGMSDRDQWTDVHYSQEEMNAIVAEAHRYGLKVMTHCTCNPAAKMAVTAGVDCIIHGEGLDKELKGLLSGNDVVWLPTLGILRMLRNPLGLPVRENPILSKHFDNVRDYYAEGVRIALGSDTFADDMTPFGRHGLREIKELMNAGLDSMAALRVATVEGGRLLGQEQSLGSLKVGAAADVLLVQGRLDLDPSVLDDAAKVVFVMREGEIVKDFLRLSNHPPKDFGPFRQLTGV
jgi:imidazolonepropionase-like amidohydrolase